MSDQEPGHDREPQESEHDREPQEPLNRIRAAAFFAADHVDSVGGKLYTNGGFFNMLRFPNYPAIVQTLGIGASLVVPWHAYQQDHHFVVTLHDEDRRALPLRVEGGFRVGADILLRHGDPSIINIAGNVTNVVFERPGHYHLQLHVDDEELARWNLQVVQLPDVFPSATTPGLPQT
ncbi:MAG TPA: hypothetical protein VGK42_07970 [Candidatus Dormibacteraeota bacterium]|jgi:hypothetical protein